jgi:poly(3-hydroxybutyrate) depolymerase
MSIERRAMLAAIASPAIAQSPLPEGPSRTTFAEPTAGGEMSVWLHRPAAWRPGGPVVAVLHGAGRTARGYRDAWVSHAEARNFLLVCPEFSRAAYPGSAAYNDGGSVGRA